METLRENGVDILEVYTAEEWNENRLRVREIEKQASLELPSEATAKEWHDRYFHLRDLRASLTTEEKEKDPDLDTRMRITLGAILAHYREHEENAGRDIFEMMQELEIEDVKDFLHGPPPDEKCWGYIEEDE